MHPGSPEGWRSREEPQENEPVVRSGSMNSQLDKYTGKDLRVPPEKMWMKDLAKSMIRLLPLLPPDSFGQLVKFLNAIPEEKKEEAAKSLTDEIKSKPVDRPMTAKDQLEILGNAIESVSQRYTAEK